MPGKRKKVILNVEATLDFNSAGLDRVVFYVHVIQPGFRYLYLPGHAAVVLRYKYLCLALRDKDMPGKRKKVILTAVVIVVAVAAFIIYRRMSEPDNYYDKYAGYDLDSDVQGVSRDGTYAKYLQQYENAARPASDIEVDVFGYTDGTNVSVQTDYEGEAKVLVTEDDSSVLGRPDLVALIIFLNLRLVTPYAGEGQIVRTGKRNAAINVEATLDFNSAGLDRVVFYVHPRWQSAYFKDIMGYYSEPYQYYFTAGENTITLECVNEPMAIRKLVISAIDEQPDYEKYYRSRPPAP